MPGLVDGHLDNGVMYTAQSCRGLKVELLLGEWLVVV